MLINLIHRFNYPKTPFSVSENGVFHFVNLRFPFCIYHPTKTYSEYSLFAIGSIIYARPPCLLLSWLKRGFESGRSSISLGSDCHLSRLPGHPTTERNEYQVLRLDFSKPVCTKDTIEENVNGYLDLKYANFVSKYAKYYPEDYIRKFEALKSTSDRVNYVHIMP